MFLIEKEQLNLLRGWIDKTRTFELIYSITNAPYIIQMNCSVISQDLCNKVERIYTDFGKYLHRYVCSSAQILIDKFKNAIQVCFFLKIDDSEKRKFKGIPSKTIRY